jgi:hypothetical protein
VLCDGAKRLPTSALLARSENIPHVLLDGSLTHMHTQFQEFPANPLSAPKPIPFRYLSDQLDGFRGNLGRVIDQAHDRGKP